MELKVRRGEKPKTSNSVEAHKDSVLSDKDEDLEDGKSYQLDANTPTYSGKREKNVEKWILLISNNIKAVGVPKEKKLYVITI